jgi:NhaA family Na+:H+ antiporter
MLRPFREFARFQASGGILLISAALIAIVWSNSEWSNVYVNLWQETYFSLALSDHTIKLSLLHWINDLLMAMFFFLVGLEIKRELLVGQLASFRKAALPVCAAIGGMLVPGLFYASLNIGGALRGWGVPVATDIAFALGVLALLGSRIPVGLKVFLASLAIADDIGALVVIAMFYTEQINVGFLIIGAGILLILIVLNRLGFRSPTVYLLLGLPLWFMVHESGIHATIAGVVLAMTIPARASVASQRFGSTTRRALESFENASPEGGQIMTNARMLGAVHAIDHACNQVETPLQRLEHSLHPWVAFLIVPLFALANAGVEIQMDSAALSDRITLGVILGLCLGKPIGIMLFSWVSVCSGFASLPDQVSWMQLLGVACLGGIGFTMSLFIAHLAFADHGQLVSAKIGIMAASFISAVAGYWILWQTARVDPRT